MKLYAILIVGLLLGFALATVTLPVLAQSERGKFDHPNLAERYGGTYDRPSTTWRGPADSERSSGSYQPPRANPC